MIKNIKRYTSILFYLLLFAGILIATYLIVSDARGYEYNLRTGEVNIKGLLLLESTPTDATVFVDDERINAQTGDRIELTAESHQIRLTKDGYRPWQKKVRILGERVTDLTYPRLFPERVQTETLRSVDRGQMSPSYDNRKAVLYDTDKLVVDILNLTQPELPALESVDLTVTEGVTAQSTIEDMQWSSDNRYILIMVRTGNTMNVLYLDSESFELRNLTDTFSLPLRNVRFDHRNSDDLFWLQDGRLRLLDISSETVSAPLLENVQQFEQYEDKIAYLERGDIEDKLSLNLARISDSISPQRVAFVERRAYDLFYRSIQAEDTILLAGDNEPIRIYSIGSELIPSERVVQIQAQSFLSDYRQSKYIVGRSENKFFTLDPSTGESYQFSMPYESIHSLRWLDGSYIGAIADGQAVIFEFDGKNPIEITQADNTMLRNGSFTELYSIDKGRLQKSLLRLDEDNSIF